MIDNTQYNKYTNSEKIVYSILDDIMSYRGSIKETWGSINESTQNEITQSWIGIAEKIINDMKDDYAITKINNMPAVQQSKLHMGLIIKGVIKEILRIADRIDPYKIVTNGKIGATIMDIPGHSKRLEIESSLVDGIPELYPIGTLNGHDVYIDARLKWNSNEIIFKAKHDVILHKLILGDKLLMQI